MSLDDERALQARFQSLRRQDAALAPDFETVLRRPRRRSQALPLAMVGAAIAVLVTVAIGIRIAAEPIALEPERAALPPWPLATAGLAEVFESSAPAFGRFVPSDALYRMSELEVKEQP